MTSPSVFSTREYQHGDANAINNLYCRVTGRNRSEGEYEWQWILPPAGQGSIYLIHAKSDENVDPLLIGHHGIIPLRFSDNNYIGIAGKTENTMVDPAYRNKILYPRYESRFKAQYSNKYDVLFSTMGPPAAIKQRRVHGYIEVGTWEIFTLSTRRALIKTTLKPYARISQSFNLVPLTKASLERYDFTSFWNSCKSEYPFTSSREKIDLEWRFLRNPYHSYLIAVLEDNFFPSGIGGFAIIRLPSKGKPMAMIEDIVSCNPSPSAFQFLLGKVLCSLFKKGILYATLPFVLDNSSQSHCLYMGAAIYASRLNEFRRFIGNIARRQECAGRKHGMMRWVSPNTKMSSAIDQWYITGIVFEGR